MPQNVAAVHQQAHLKLQSNVVARKNVQRTGCFVWLGWIWTLQAVVEAANNQEMAAESEGG